MEQDKKLDAKLRLEWQKTFNRIKSEFSFKRIKTWYDLYISLGYTDKEIKWKYRFEEYGKLISFTEVKDYFEQERLCLEARIFLRHNPPDTSDYKVIVQKSEEEKAIEEFTNELDKDYGLIPSPREKAFLFWFQKKAIMALLDGIIKQGKRGQLLLASTGTGKTFIAGGVLRRLLDLKFHEDKTHSPWPYLYVTKATVVEQTKRVFENYFGINTVTEVEVINIEQLRSRLGELYVQEQTVVTGGEAHIVWKWRDKINPVIVFLDECQVVKNEGSTQSKIMQSYNELENSYLISISATPFTRVCEAKVFAVSTRKEISF